MVNLSLNELMTDEFTDEFTENMIKIIELIRKYPRISLNEIAERLGITKRGVINNTNKLKELGALEREGTPKNGKWKVTINKSR